MSFIDAFELAQNEAFVQRVQQAMVKSAIAVSAESPSDPANLVLDAARLSYATTVLRDPPRNARLMAFGVVTNGTITAESSDSDIEFTVNSMWSAYSGVNPNTLVAV